MRGLARQVQVSVGLIFQVATSNAYAERRRLEAMRIRL
jgi:hypothetical protein